MSIKIMFLFILLIAILSLRQKNIKKNKTKKTVKDRKKIKKIDIGYTEIKGKIRALETITSPFTHSKCIGYLFTESEYNNSRKRGNSGNYKISRENKWKDLETQTECCDFYIEDKTGKVKVEAEGIILITEHITKKRKIWYKNIFKTEFLLLEDGVDYILKGEIVYNKKKEMIFKDTGKNMFIIMPETIDKKIMTSYIVDIIIIIVVIVISIILFLYV